MKIPTRFIFAIILIPLLLYIAALFLGSKNNNANSKIVLQNSPTPTPATFGLYTPPKISQKDFYTIVMVGDSMTEELGPHGGKLSEFLNSSYQSTPGHQKIVIDNYATGSTNLLGLQNAMRQKKVISDKTLDPLLSRQFDLILIESFGYNPLSQLGLTEGLKKQTQTLDQIMKLLTKTHPNAMIIFVATIAPNKESYGQQEDPHASVAERTQQAKERIEYIKNHMAYANAHNIPLIDIYDKSLTAAGDGNLTYINPNDHIHPSFAGVDFISHEIANYIYENKILPR